MRYTVIEDYDNLEFGFVLFPGEDLYDGDVEPDVLANLMALGVVEADVSTAATPPVVEVEDEPEDEEDA